MQKRLRFLYRYLFGRQRWRRWANMQSLLVIIISSAFLATLYMTAPLSSTERNNRSWKVQATSVAAQSMQESTPADADPALEEQPPSSPTRTPLPPEYLYNADQTIGVALAGAILVAIVVVGALMFMPRHEDE